MKARFGQVSDYLGQPRPGLAKLVTRLARSRTRFVKARARSLTNCICFMSSNCQELVYSAVAFFLNVLCSIIICFI